jgi:hypothetical protein
VLSILLAVMGTVGAVAAAILVTLRLSKPDFMPTVSIPFASLYMVVAAVLAYAGIHGFRATLGGNVNRAFSNLVQRRGWRANE